MVAGTTPDNGKLPVRSDRRAELGQYFTPPSIADFMASLFHDNGRENIRVLDAGTGEGALIKAFCARFGASPRKQIEALMFELDENLSASLNSGLNICKSALAEKNILFQQELIQGDFIIEGGLSYLSNNITPVDYVILNPPYKKINSQSIHRRMLRKAGIETVNLYTGFIGLAIHFLKDQGELVAIVPRSFCNGVYYKLFREFLLLKTSIQHIHLFSSRKEAFKENDVLQENIIIHIKKHQEEQRQSVKISMSKDSSFSDYTEQVYDFEDIVHPNDQEKFIHIPLQKLNQQESQYKKITCTLADLGIDVSTGPVVDFRVKAFLLKEYNEDAVPLLYPAHFEKKNILWPKPNFKKYNALILTPETQKQLYPAGYYVLVRRLTSKEEKRRIVARILAPDNLPGEHVALENHLNVFHRQKKGLPKYIALGLAVYLNSTVVDQCFRQFNGHTQVNATDLRSLKYPEESALIKLGEWIEKMESFDQESVDDKILTTL